MPHDFEAKLLELGVVDALRPPPASEGEVEGFEQKIGARLPSDYRAFIQAYGGFRAEDGGGPWPDRPRLCCTFASDLWYSCAEPAPFGGQSIVWFWPLAHIDKLRDASAIIPPTMIAIAEGESSDCTCLSFQGDDAGSVYALDIQFLHEWSDERFHQYPNLGPGLLAQAPQT